ncbi:MAG: DNA polymerase III subunit gamma/tau [Kiloniellaceae bacterium]
MTDQPAAATTPYRVLARKYRPAAFADLIGQEALVRTLTNAIESGRLAHAYILTGVRGVGKTTTARIIARALNCVRPDGAGGPTAEPCGRCENCVAITQDRHVDVIEMDAASRTGIDDVRELVEGVRYRPVQARKKVYIIDEVHMLSKPAFNGLLKTLEEPPEHIVFIFATTEIRKVPVTVLSRCQRFDLRRVDQDLLARHFAGIAKAEGVEVAAKALALIARAADGSVRDGLSLLDQAIALGGRRVEEEQVREMLGLADRTQVFDLFEALMRGRAPEALALLGELYSAGADPAVVLQDLLELAHFVTRAKLVPGTVEAPDVPEAERVRGRALAEALSLPALARTWQILLKGLGEVQAAPAPLRGAEMVLIRLAYASELPSPAELVARLSEAVPGPAAAPSTASSGAAPTAEGDQPIPGPTARTRETARAEPRPEPRSDGGPQAALAPRVRPAPEADDPAATPAETVGAPPAGFAEVVALARARRETILANHLANDVHLVSFEPGRIELRPTGHAPRNLAGQLGALLQDATSERWVVSVSQERGDPTLRDQARTAAARRRDEALEHPLVRAALQTFPGARLVEPSGGPSDAQRAAAGEPGAWPGPPEAPEPDSGPPGDLDASDEGDDTA